MTAETSAPAPSDRLPMPWMLVVVAWIWLAAFALFLAA